MFPRKTTDQTLVTKVEKEVDKIRDKIYQEAQRVGWNKYWKEVRSRSAAEGYKLVSSTIVTRSS